MFINKFRKVIALSLIMGSFDIPGQAMEKNVDLFKSNVESNKLYLNDLDMFASMVDVALEVLCLIKIDHLSLFRQLINSDRGVFYCPQCKQPIKEFDCDGMYEVGYCPGSSGCTLANALKRDLGESINTSNIRTIKTDNVPMDVGIDAVDHAVPLHYDFKFLKYICNNAKDIIKKIKNQPCKDNLQSKVSIIASILGSNNEEGLFEKIDNFKKSNNKDSDVTIDAESFLSYFLTVCTILQRFYEEECNSNERSLQFIVDYINNLIYNINYMKTLIEDTEFKQLLSEYKEYYFKSDCQIKKEFKQDIKNKFENIKNKSLNLTTYI